MLTALPVAVRELRVAARRPAIYWARFVGAMLTLVVTFWFFFMARPAVAPASLGAELFNATAGLFFAYALLAGLRATADSLSSEKRDGTLGLLFLTDLSGLDIVAGKLVATGMNCVYALMAGLPMLSLPLLLGGVSLGLVWHAALVLMNTLFLSLTAGILASALCRSDRRAGVLAVLLLFAVVAGAPLAGALLTYYGWVQAEPSLPEAFAYPSSVALFVSTLRSYSVAGAGVRAAGEPFFWASFVTQHAVAWLFLLFAARVVPKSWQDTPASAARERRRLRWARWTYGDSAARAALRRAQLDINPFLWLCGGRDRVQRAMLWGVLGLLAAGFVYGWAKLGEEWLCAPVAVMTILAGGGLLKYWLAGASSRQFLDIKRDGALELLVSTPLTVDEMLQGQSLAMRRLLGGPLVAVVIVDFLMFAVALREAGGEERTVLGLAFIATLLLLGADYFALMWVGTLQGLTAKSPRHAGGNTVSRILFLPWIVFMLSLPLLALCEMVLGVGFSPDGVTLVLYWFALGLGVDLLYGVTAYRKLQREFRTMAAERFQPSKPRGWWRVTLHD